MKKQSKFETSENIIFSIWNEYYNELNKIINNALSENDIKLCIEQDGYTSPTYVGENDEFQSSYILKFDNLKSTNYHDQIIKLRYNLLSELYTLEVENISNIIQNYDEYVQDRTLQSEQSREFFNEHIRSENVSLAEPEPIPTINEFQNFINPYHKNTKGDISKIWNSLSALNWNSFWMNELVITEKEVYKYMSNMDIGFPQYFIEKVYVFNKNLKEETAIDDDFPELPSPEFLPAMNTIYLSSPFDILGITKHFNELLITKYGIDKKLSDTFIKNKIYFY